MNSEMWQRLIHAHLEQSQKPLVVVLGPTASGKTGLSIDIAKHIGNAEVVNADSRQLYKYLDIGTAKITEAEMEGVPHHLIDVFEPSEEATAGWYQTAAREVIDDIVEQEKVPLLVGGSMLYLSTITDALTMAPTSDPELRERLLQEYDVDDGATLHARLKEYDPEAAERLHQNNKPRLVRAVEIFELLEDGQEAIPKTEICAGEEFDGERCPYDLLILGLNWDREILKERINLRAKQMFEQGWIEEVEELLKQGLGPQDPGMKSHGYREIMAYLEGSFDDLDALRELISAKTRQYSRRQMVWWKRDQRIKWLDGAGL